ncbi:DEAD/DEAH box helicase [Azospira restricta]|uniref:DEAD/DEAH box helicase n=1 Tax=Azospira restricta TaxID=404405 RepID=A0A974SMK9_9RHOO|nr:DEAD/DEAH box helicase [Azospira restricta]QRJ62770.1 DEAD/DEAH box helicase [Azospira restricta]
MTFEEIGLHPAILKALADAGYTEPTPVQAQAIPAAIEGRDLLVSSQTGSGKTAAFMLPSMHKLAVAAQDNPLPAVKTPNQERQSARARGERPRYAPAQPKMLVLTPTRELALQVTTATEKYGANLRRMKAVSILGGMPYPKQMQLLARNPEILVATPGRLIDHMNSGKIDFSQLQILVLDEADRMLDMGFIDDIETIIAATPAARQTMLFSATLEGDVGRMAERITREPQVIRIAGSQTKHENIEQKVHFVDDLAHKNRLLDHLLRDAALQQAVIFTATKRDADAIADQLNADGFAAAPLHGDMHQGARNRTLNALRRGQLRILVATDVAARGIDVPGITHVFNYDLPKFPEDYVHRIGRTGRAGRSGVAVSLVHHAEGIHVKRIERFTKQVIPVDVVPGHEPQRTPAPRKAKPAGWKPGQGRGGNKPSGDRYGKGGGYSRDGGAYAGGEKHYGKGPRPGGFGPRNAEGFNEQRPDNFGNRPERDRSQGRPDNFGNRTDRPDTRPDNFGNRADYQPRGGKPQGDRPAYAGKGAPRGDGFGKTFGKGAPRPGGQPRRSWTER